MYGRISAMARIETVFLDAGGVLVWPNWNRVADALAWHGVTADPWRLAEGDALARFSLDEAHMAGRSTDQRRSTSFFDLVLIEAGVEPSAATAAALAWRDCCTRQKAHDRAGRAPPLIRPGNGPDAPAEARPCRYLRGR